MATADVGQPFLGGLPRMTRHASKRHQQRAIPPLVTSWILEFGTSVRHAGADVLYLDKRGRKRLRDAVGGERSLRLIEPMLNTYLVLGDDGVVVTAARRQHRFKRP